MITYRWTERHTTTSGVTYTRHVTISERISDAFQTYYHWPSQLAANLAMASLLCKAADMAYVNRGDDERRWRLGRHDARYNIGPYPERQL